MEEGHVTREELTTRTGLPDRTIRFAIARLKEAGLVEVRRSLRDARRLVLFKAKGSGD